MSEGKRRALETIFGKLEKLLPHLGNANPHEAAAALGKINALLEGRFNVSFEDSEAVAAPALRHRILLNFEGMAEGISPDAIVTDVLKSLPKTK